MSTDTIPPPPPPAVSADRRAFAVDPNGATGRALAALAAAVDGIAALDPLTLNEPELMGVLDGIEVATRRLPAVRDPFVAEADVREVWRSRKQRSMSAFLQDNWQLSAGEAHTWLAHAEAFTCRRSITSGEELPAALPVLGAARAAGRVSPAQTKVIADMLAKLPSGLDMSERMQAEATMVAFARDNAPLQLGQLGQLLSERLDPDGRYRDPEEIKRRRGLVFGREKDGLTRISGYLDAWTAAALRAALEALANPCRDSKKDGGPANSGANTGRANGNQGGCNQSGDDNGGGDDESGNDESGNDESGDDNESGNDQSGNDESGNNEGRDGDWQGDDAEQRNTDPAAWGTDPAEEEGHAAEGPAPPTGVSVTDSTGLPDGCPRVSPTDSRTTPQRLHDALRDAMELLLGSGGLPAQAGLPATIVIITRLEDLVKRTGYASTGHGALIHNIDVIRHAAKAKLIDLVVDRHGNPLFLGRTRRLATYSQRLALAARDRGCVRPGCTVPAVRTEAHHITAWADGGRTNVDELALLCAHDHDTIDGWTLELISGRIWCTPPPWIDPTQTPRLNNNFHEPPELHDETLFGQE